MSKLLCRLFGHKWKKTHEEMVSGGLYAEFKCKRCGKEYQDFTKYEDVGF